MSNSDENRELDTVLAAYLEAAAAGLAPDREELIRTHPHLADDLRRFFVGEDAIEAIAAPLRSEGGHADASDPSSAASWPHIPGYEILGELGRGGMGVVYKARQLSLNRVVALKMILSGAHAAPAARARFVSEAQAVARLQHPNIVPVHEVGTHEGLPFFSMELCEGGSLADVVSQGVTLPADAARMVETVARAVQACHERHIIHRDLKPANVLLATDGTPKVSDFGLAKDLDADSRTTSSAVVGTPCYMAPEQAAGRRDQIGPATDVYALGALLYELLAGHPPFQGVTPVATVLRVVSEEPSAPRRAGANVPRDLVTICMKCLNKEPVRRYKTAMELAGDLQRFQRGEPVQARSVGQVERLWRWCRRNPAVAALLAAVAMALMMGTTVTSVFAIRAEEEAGRARHAEATAVKEGEHAKQQWTRAEQEAARARQEGEHAKQEWTRAEGLLYSAQIALAQGEWEDNNADNAWAHLDSIRPEFRGWEYGYLHT
jgi:serine/threonine protein kinase